MTANSQQMGAEGPRPKRLGIIEMATRPLRLLGAMGNPDSHHFPVTYRTARGAFTDAVLAGNPDVIEAYIEAARSLEADGVDAIMATCGFTIAFQEELAAAVSVPTATSSLLALPMALRIVPAGAKVGVVTFDKRRLEKRHFLAAGVSEHDHADIVITGLEDTLTWHELSRDVPELSDEALAKDALDIIGRFIGARPDVRCLLLECSALGPFSQQIRQEFKVPVFDFLSVADALMASVAGRSAQL